jgi:hypothetical protein
MEQLVETISSSKPETLWHRDTLFQYLLTMEKLQENMKEYQELMNLAGTCKSEEEGKDMKKGDCKETKTLIFPF